ncbi:hypothetical protein DPEC_G00019670 [Dallia pectoralis]|uniref:Uncharacterized protein n=1 Tax=Dallia pectoralis TaxID=75939 RepID=A0ACC2HGN0_DALPE|nr:hypothetical protein DPEC_G00019670 [Dallia pectoralis]
MPASGPLCNELLSHTLDALEYGPYRGIMSTPVYPPLAPPLSAKGPELASPTSTDSPSNNGTGVGMARSRFPVVVPPPGGCVVGS